MTTSVTSHGPTQCYGDLMRRLESYRRYNDRHRAVDVRARLQLHRRSPCYDACELAVLPSTTVEGCASGPVLP